MTKPTELDQQMLSYLMAMSREEQERIPQTRADVIAWLGTEVGLLWLRASPVGKELSQREYWENMNPWGNNAANVE